MIVRWEKGNVIPRPINQQGLDTILSACSPDVQARFAEMIGLTSPATSAQDPGVSSEQLASPQSEPDVPVGDEDQVRHPVDGKLMTLVPAYVYFAGENNEPVYLPAFYIDVFPTTNADYARFVAATDYKPPQHWENGDIPEGLENHPVVFVTWHDAHAYAQWSAKTLPSAQQWEKAARGTRGEIYPWGNQRTPLRSTAERAESAPQPRRLLRKRRQPVRRLRHVRQHLGLVLHRDRARPPRAERQRLHKPLPPLRPSTFNDAAADMLDDDTGFRCATPAETMRALRNVRGQSAT